MQNEKNPTRQGQKETSTSSPTGSNLSGGTSFKKLDQKWKPAWCGLDLKPGQYLINACKNKIMCPTCEYSKLDIKRDFCNLHNIRPGIFCNMLVGEDRTECFKCEFFINFN